MADLSKNQQEQEVSLLQNTFSADVLEELATVTTRQEVLEELAHCKLEKVRGAVAFNKNTTKEMLKEFLYDESWYVRQLANLRLLRMELEGYSNKP